MIFQIDFKRYHALMLFYIRTQTYVEDFQGNN